MTTGPDVNREVYDPEELVKLIDSSPEAWKEGRQQLFDGRIPAWLRATGNDDIAAKWADIAAQYAGSKDEGLEAFLRLLKPDIPDPRLSIRPSRVEMAGIRPGKTQKAVVTVSNAGRGFLTGPLELVPALDAVSVQPTEASACNLLDISTPVTVTVDTSRSLRGKASLKLTTNAGAAEVPVSYSTTFPYPLLYPWIGAALGIFLGWLLLTSSGPLGSAIGHNGRQWIDHLTFTVAGLLMAWAVVRVLDVLEPRRYIAGGAVAGLICSLIFGSAGSGRFVGVSVAVFAFIGYMLGRMLLRRVDFPWPKQAQTQASIGDFVLTGLVFVGLAYEAFAMSSAWKVIALVPLVVLGICVGVRYGQLQSNR